MIRLSQYPKSRRSVLLSSLNEDTDHTAQDSDLVPANHISHAEASDHDPPQTVSASAPSSPASTRSSQSAGRNATAASGRSSPREEYLPNIARGFRWDVFLFGVFVSCVALTGGVMWIAIQPDRYGMRTARTGSDPGELKTFTFWAITLPVNILSGLIVFSSDYVRKRLKFWSPGGNERAWKMDHWVPKILWLVLALSSLPIHMLFNALLIASVPAYDAYVVLVDDRFFTGSQGDVTKINMTEFPDQLGAPMPFHTSWPSDWPGSLELQRNLQMLQKDPSSWTNISKRDCKLRYAEGIFSTYRHVVLVTDWAPNPPPVNSVLAVAATPGFPPFDLSNRFLSLCPDVYIAVTPNASRPVSAPYMEPDCAEKLTPELECIVLMKYVYAPLSPDFVGTDHEKQHLTQDMCYYYRPQVGYDDHPKTDPFNFTQQLSLSYCLSEPMNMSTSRIVWSRYIHGIVVIALIIKAVAMMISWLYMYFDTEFARLTSPETTRLSRRELYLYLMILIAIIVLTIVLRTDVVDVFREGSSPTHSGDKDFMIDILMYQNCLHLLLVLRQFMEENIYQKRKSMGWIIEEASIDSFDAICFVWNLLAHVLVAVWSRTMMVDRYPLGSDIDDSASYTPTMVPTLLFFHVGIFFVVMAVVVVVIVHAGILLCLMDFWVGTAWWDEDEIVGLLTMDEEN